MGFMLRVVPMKHVLGIRLEKTCRVQWKSQKYFLQHVDGINEEIVGIGPPGADTLQGGQRALNPPSQETRKKKDQPVTECRANLGGDSRHHRRGCSSGGMTNTGWFDPSAFLGVARDSSKDSVEWKVVRCEGQVETRRNARAMRADCRTLWLVSTYIRYTWARRFLERLSRAGAPVFFDVVWTVANHRDGNCEPASGPLRSTDGCWGRFPRCGWAASLQTWFSGTLVRM